ncbi:hypothetical protein [Metarhizobium album]|uniref:hypothetical protein n=1 Tax=Metarhizobium album TaxID=2182425 RepID=UPI001402EF83|nr:hypothetical protein [Rhizobium album]
MQQDAEPSHGNTSQKEKKEGTLRQAEPVPAGSPTQRGGSRIQTEKCYAAHHGEWRRSPAGAKALKAGRFGRGASSRGRDCRNYENIWLVFPKPLKSNLVHILKRDCATGHFDDSVDHRCIGTIFSGLILLKIARVPNTKPKCAARQGHFLRQSPLA